MMRTILTILLLSAATASAAFLIWQSGVPDATRSLPLCQRVRSLEFDQKSTGWLKLDTPIMSVVVCAIPGTTGELKVDGIIQPYVDSPLADQMVEVDCYKSARIKSGAPALRMPDGLFCNIPAIVK